MRPERIVCPDPDALADRAAAWVVGALRARALTASRVRLALSGGSTPRALYRRLARDPFRPDVPWDELHVYWGDERAVPPDHEASNYRMAKEALLDHVPLSSAQIHRIEGERDDAAAHYEAQLRAEAAEGETALDVVLLGMGTDGHTASLFPGTPQLDTARWVVQTTSPQPPTERISLSLTALNATPLVVVLVTGAPKAERLAQVFSEIEAGHPTLPLSFVEPRERLVWIMDEAAARRLPTDDAKKRGTDDE